MHRTVDGKATKLDCLKEGTVSEIGSLQNQTHDSNADKNNINGTISDRLMQKKVEQKHGNTENSNTGSSKVSGSSKIREIQAKKKIAEVPQSEKVEQSPIPLVLAT